MTGFVRIVGSDKADRLRANVAALRDIGVRTEVVTPEQMRVLAPSMEVAGDELGAWEPDGGYADPTATAAASFAGRSTRARDSSRGPQ